MEQLNEALAKLITQATAGNDTSVDFLQAQLPDVIVQLLMWHGVKSGILFVIGILIFIGLVIADIYFGNKLYKILEEGNDTESFWLFYIFIGSMFRATLLAAINITFLNLTWLQIWIAPKVWLIEYAARLVQ